MTRTFDWNQTTREISMSELGDRDLAIRLSAIMPSDAMIDETILAARDRIMCLVKEKAELAGELDRIRNAGLESHDAVCQTLGKALGYPRYCDDQKNFPGATDADGVCVGDHVAESIADEAAKRIAQLSERAKVLDRYREVMEAAHGVRIYAVDHLLEHFNADGTLKGDGQWRLKEIYQHVKAFDESSSRAAEMADMQSPVMTDDTIDRLSGRELCDLCCIAVGDIGAAMGLLLQCGRGVEVYVYPSNQIIVTSSGCETTGPKSEAATIFCRASLKLKHRNPSL